jgi:radical SAM protein with 4Fe4S-binding SPASM domain
MANEQQVKQVNQRERLPEPWARPLIRKQRLKTSIRETVRFLSGQFGREFRYHRTRAGGALLFLTYRCTSRCKTCTLWQRTDATGELSLSEWKRVVDDCAELGAKYFELFGGDALLRPDVLIPLTVYIKSIPGLSCDLVTNCNLMTEKVARGLVDAGLDVLWVSIDGIADDHHKVRGHDKTWIQLERTIDWFMEARGSDRHPYMRANTTISNLNYNTFDRVLPYAEEKGLDTVHFEYAGEFWDELLDSSVIDGIRPNPYFVQQDGKSILVNEEQARIVKSKVAKMKEDARLMGIQLQTENIDTLTVNQMTTGMCDNRRCYIMRDKITIDPQGNIVGCPFYGNWVLGNVKQQNIPDIWDNDKHRAFKKHFKKRFSNGNMSICDHCILGVQRNPTVVQNIREHINWMFSRGRK